MSVQLSYAGETEQNNTKGLLFKATFTGVYGVKGVGDLLNLAPVGPNNPGGVTDPNLAYNLILAEPPSPNKIGVLGEQLGGYYLQIQSNANPTLQNFGVRAYAPDGSGELATGAAYPAAMLAGQATLEIFIPLQ